MLALDTDQLEVRGSRADLRWLANRIRNARDSISEESVTNLERPAWLQISASSGPVTIFYIAGKLVIEGTSDKLAVLATNIETLADEVFDPKEINPHLHIEYVPGHFYLGAGSEPLIVTLEEGDSGGSTNNT